MQQYIVTLLLSILVATSSLIRAEGVTASVVPHASARLGAYRHLTYPALGDHTHLGVDILADEGSDIRAMADGFVVDVINSSSDANFDSLGYMVILRHPGIGKQGTDVYSLSIHMQETPVVSLNGWVDKGDPIGKVGKTGHAEDISHVHYEIRYFPERFSSYNNIYAPGDARSDPYALGNWEDPETFVPFSEQLSLGSFAFTFIADTSTPIPESDDTFKNIWNPIIMNSESEVAFQGEGERIGSYQQRYALKGIYKSKGNGAVQIIADNRHFLPGLTRHIAHIAAMTQAPAGISFLIAELGDDPRRPMVPYMPSCWTSTQPPTRIATPQVLAGWSPSECLRFQDNCYWLWTQDENLDALNPWVVKPTGAKQIFGVGDELIPATGIRVAAGGWTHPEKLAGNEETAIIHCLYSRDSEPGKAWQGIFAANLTTEPHSFSALAIPGMFLPGVGATLVDVDEHFGFDGRHVLFSGHLDDGTQAIIQCGPAGYSRVTNIPFVDEAGHTVSVRFGTHLSGGSEGRFTLSTDYCLYFLRPNSMNGYSLHRVAGKGDSIGTKTISSAGTNLNGHTFGDSVAVLARFTDSSMAIYAARLTDAVVEIQPPAQRVVLAFGHDLPRNVIGGKEVLGLRIPAFFAPGSTPGKEIPQTKQLEALGKLEEIFFGSAITGINFVSGPPEEDAMNVYFVDESEAPTLWGKSNGIDRFNKDPGGLVAIFAGANLSDVDYETIAHEVGHLLGLRHIDPNVGGGDGIEVMDDGFSLDPRFVNNVSEITDVASFATHNPRYHLRRYLNGEAHAELVSQGVNPGTYDQSARERLRLLFLRDTGAGSPARDEPEDEGGDRTLYDVNILEINGGPDTAVSLAHFNEISLSSLAAISFEIERGSTLTVLAASVPGGNVDIVLATGDPTTVGSMNIDPEDATVTPTFFLDTGGSAVPLESVHFTTEVLSVSPEIATIEHNGASNSTILSFQTQPTYAYALQRSHDLRADSWDTFISDIEGTGVSMKVETFEDSSFTETFYRLHCMPMSPSQ